MSTGYSRDFSPRCQERQNQPANWLVQLSRYTQNISTLAVASLILFSAIGLNAQSAQASDRDEIPDRLFSGDNAPQQLASSRVVHDRLIAPPMEETFFPGNYDGQSKVLNIDSTVNMTIAINQFYYNPAWRGECWVPFDQVELIERASRLMSTWKEYNEANQYHVLNRINVFLERFSGFGP